MKMKRPDTSLTKRMKNERVHVRVEVKEKRDGDHEYQNIDNLLMHPKENTHPSWQTTQSASQWPSSMHIHRKKDIKKTRNVKTVLIYLSKTRQAIWSKSKWQGGRIWLKKDLWDTTFSTQKQKLIQLFKRKSRHKSPVDKIIWKTRTNCRVRFANLVKSYRIISYHCQKQHI